MQSAAGQGSPIIVDTDGSGFHLTSVSNGVIFDFFGDGRPVHIAWPAPGSSNGWLALDQNGNGKSDSARELFGNLSPQPSSTSVAPNGFRALAIYDTKPYGGNGDHHIDNQDAVWSRLLVWINANHDGVSQPSELHHLDDVGIRTIDLKYVEVPRVDEFGNQFRYKGWLNPLKPDGVDRVIYDVFLQYAQQ